MNGLPLLVSVGPAKSMHASSAADSSCTAFGVPPSSDDDDDDDDKQEQSMIRCNIGGISESSS